MSRFLLLYTLPITPPAGYNYFFTTDDEQFCTVNSKLLAVRI